MTFGPTEPGFAYCDGRDVDEAGVPDLPARVEDGRGGPVIVVDGPGRPRVATAADAAVVAELLDRFNREFDSPTPGPAVLAARLERLLAGRDVVALLAGEPAVGFGLITLRPNVWFDGPVGLLDELYVVPDSRDQGIGTALLKAAEGVCLARGGEYLEINVDGEDVDTRRFYERHGYVCREPGDPEPELYYHRGLTSGPGSD